MFAFYKENNKIKLQNLLKKLIGKNRRERECVCVKFDESCMHKYCIQAHTSIKSNLSSKKAIFTYSVCNIKYCESLSFKSNIPKNLRFK